jgi:hypothetical protein
MAAALDSGPSGGPASTGCSSTGPSGETGDPGIRRIAVIGSGISGLAAAWLLAKRHQVTLFEADSRPGGHSNTVNLPPALAGCPVDTGFIVYNEHTYPNLTALFRHLGVPTIASEMSFAVSLDGGGFEYSGSGWGGLLAQRRNLLRPRFWHMMRDVLRFYREAPELARRGGGQDGRSLGAVLSDRGYGASFIADHLLPMAAAIWSAPPQAMLDFPFQAFVRFFENHGLLKFRDRPLWRTVAGGSKVYVGAMLADAALELRLDCPVREIHGGPAGPELVDATGARSRFDAIVMACHADQALAMLAQPNRLESDLLGCFRYQQNDAVLHTDESLMPLRRRVWSSWNVLQGRDAAAPIAVTYWMNRLQRLALDRDVFVTLNPVRAPRPDSVLARLRYSHPLFDGAAIAAQARLWELQGTGGLWYCGAYFGSGFHEDGLQAGLAVAEAIGGLRRPWTVPDESGRIRISRVAAQALMAA